MATLTIRGALTDATIEAGVAGFGLVIEASVDAKYSVRTNTGGAGPVYLQPIDDTGTGSDDSPYESYTNTGTAAPVSTTTGAGGAFEVQINMQPAEREARSIEDFFEDEGYSYTGGLDTYKVTVTARRPSGAIVAAATVKKFPQTAGFPIFDVNTLRIPRRRVVILDIDGLRWDVFRKHLRTVRDAPADLDRTYHFLKLYDATQHTVIGLGQDLRSALAVLCFHPGMGRTEVRLARAPFPSYTFPSHGTMFTGLWPNLHGIAGNAYVKRDASFQWKPRNWEALPDGPALQGYCTGSDENLTGLDHWWNGLAESDANDCPDRNRGLVSDLPAFVTLYDRATETAGLRSLVIHNFYHSAAQPWTDAGKDIWWHMTNPEVRTIKDVCSEDDADEAEPVDSAAFVKAELALSFVPHTLRTTVQGAFPYPTADFNYADLVDKLSGEKKTSYSHLEGQSDSSGGPDLLTIYVASVDQASHKRGVANQATYLAWFDHRLALFVKALMAKDPIRFNNTVFALVADHGHADLVEKPPGPARNDLAVREEICRLRFGNQKLEELRRLAELYPYLNYPRMVEDAIADVAVVFGQGMNLYVYLRDPSGMLPETVARALLAMTMDVVPAAALVRTADGYQLLQRNRGPDPVDGEAARIFFSDHLQVPTEEQDSEVDDYQLDAADGAAERALRAALRQSAGPGGTRAYDLLGVAARIRGFGPRADVPARRSPDIVLLAPPGQSFTYRSGPGPAANHGSLAYPVTRVPMMFFGPGIDGEHSVPAADMIDFTPTVLALFGIDSRPFGLDGTALLRYDGTPIRDRLPVDGIPSSAEVVITGPIKRPTQLASADLSIASVRDVQSGEVAADVPWSVLVGLRTVKRRTPRLIDEATMLYEFDAAELSVFGVEDQATWSVESAAPVRTRSLRLSLDKITQSVRMTAGDLVQDLKVPRLLAVRLVSLELPTVPDWLRFIVHDARRRSVPLRFVPRRLPAGSTTSKPLSNILLDAGTFFTFTRHAGARADGARIIAAEQAIAEAMRTTPAASSLPVVWSAFRDAARTSKTHSVEAHDAAIASLRAAANTLPAGVGAGVLAAVTNLQNRVLKFPPAANDRERVDIGFRMLQRIVQSRETLTLRMPGVHRSW